MYTNTTAYPYYRIGPLFQTSNGNKEQFLYTVFPRLNAGLEYVNPVHENTFS